MADTRDAEGPRQIVCPHCEKSFSAELIVGDTERHRGFKCPHCKLFVRADRVSRDG